MVTPVLVLVVTIVVSIVLPARMLASLALCVAALVPITYFDLNWKLVTFNPATLILLIMAVRTARTRADALPRPRPDKWFAAFTAGFLLLTGASALMNGLPTVSVRWMVTVAPILFVLLIARPSPTSYRHLASTWTRLATAIGTYAVVEAWVLKANPLYGEVFLNSEDKGFSQSWAVYRSTGSLGHPLVLSVFLAIGCSFSISRILSDGYSAPRMLSAAVAALGVVSTGSRSGLLLLAAAFVSASLLTLTSKSRALRTAWRIAAMAVVVLVAYSSVSATLAARESSDEASQSVVTRTQLAEFGVHAAAQRPGLGWGPANTDQPAREVGGTKAGEFENSWIDIAVSQGLLSTAVLLAMLLALIAAALRNSRIDLAVAITVYSLGLGTFNLFYGYPAFLPLFAVLAVNVWSGRDAHEPGVMSHTAGRQKSRSAVQFQWPERADARGKGF